MIAHDFLLDEDGDLLIMNGDFVIGESDDDHVRDIIYCYAGWWKEYPTLGVGIMDYLSGGNIGDELKAKVKLNLVSDGYRVNKTEFIKDTTVTNNNESYIFNTDAKRI